MEIKQYLLAIQILLISFSILHSQETIINYFDSSDSTRFNEQFGISSNKINNYWEINNNINYKLKTSFGDFFLQNTYKGTVVTSITNSYREVEDFFLTYYYPIYKQYFFTSATKYNLLSDRNTITNNKLEKISEQVGITGKISDNLIFKSLYGLQDNTQSSLNTLGHLINFNLNLREFYYEGYKISSGGGAEFLYLNDGRDSRDLNLNANVSKIYTKSENILFDINYKQQKRNFLFPGSLNNTYSIEINLNNRFKTNLIGNWNPFDKCVVSVDVSTENIDIKRRTISDLNNSNLLKVERNYREWNTVLRLSALYEQGKMKHNFGLNINDKNENNTISSRLNIDDSEYLNLQFIETQKDNSSFNFNFTYSNDWLITQKDILKININLSKLEYNTPSPYNKDDRDELLHIFSVEYMKKLSPILTYCSKIYYSQKYLVFIQKERSSQNNWNRVLNFSNEINFFSSKLQYSSAFEVIANYFFYNFETFFKNLRNNSIRYFIYKDSLKIKISKKYFFESKSDFRCYEQSKLNWNAFTEFPQQRSIEFTSMPMLFKIFSNTLKTGLGVRFYNLQYGPLHNGTKFTNPTTIFSFAPQFSAKWNFNKIELKTDFWLEKRIQVNSPIIIPNYYLDFVYH